MWVEHMPPQTTATEEVVLIFNVTWRNKGIHYLPHYSLSTLSNLIVLGCSNLSVGDQSLAISRRAVWIETWGRFGCIHTMGTGCNCLTTSMARLGV
jgi:hypothetical protein